MCSVPIKLFYRYIRDNVIPDESSDPNLFVFLTYKQNQAGTVGIAWLGTVCISEKGYKVSINEWYISDLNTAEVLICSDPNPNFFLMFPQCQ